MPCPETTTVTGTCPCGDPENAGFDRTTKRANWHLRKGLHGHAPGSRAHKRARRDGYGSRAPLGCGARGLAGADVSIGDAHICVARRMPNLFFIALLADSFRFGSFRGVLRASCGRLMGGARAAHEPHLTGMYAAHRRRNLGCAWSGPTCQSILMTSTNGGSEIHARSPKVVPPEHHDEADAGSRICTGTPNPSPSLQTAPVAHNLVSIRAL